MTRSRHEAEIRRRVPLSCKAAFACFTEAHHLERWFGRGSMSAKVALHVGGKFLFDFAPGADRMINESIAYLRDEIAQLA